MIKAAGGVYIRTAVPSLSFVKYFLICTRTCENIYETILYGVLRARVLLAFRRAECVVVRERNRENPLRGITGYVYRSFDSVSTSRHVYRMLIENIKSLRSCYLTIFNFKMHKKDF